MRVLICVPSKGRPYDFEKKMLTWLSGVGIPYKVFVEEQDFIYYKQVAGKDSVIPLKKDDMGIGYCARAYSEYAVAWGYDLIWRIDDDTRGFTSKAIGNGRSGYTKEIMHNILDDVLPDFEKYENLGAVRFLHSKYSIYEAIGKNRKYTHLDDELFNARIIKPELEGLLNENITTAEDACLSVLVRDAKQHILTYGRSGINSEVNRNTGGFNMMDRAEMTKATHKYIVKRFPKIELRENKTWFGLDLNVMPYLDKIVLKDGEHEKYLMTRKAIQK